MLCYVGLCVLLQGFCNPFPHFPRRCFHLQLTGRWSVRALLANEQRQRTRRRIPLDSMCLQRRWLDKQWSGPATRHVHPFLFQWIYHHVTGLATSWAVTWRALRKNWFVKMIGNYVPSFVGTVCRLGLTLFDTRTLGMHCGFTRSVAWTTAWKWFQQCLGRLRLFGPGFGLASVQKCRRRHLNFELVGIHYIFSYYFIYFQYFSSSSLEHVRSSTVIAFCSSCFPLSMAVTISTWPSAQTEQTQHARHTVQICTVFAKHSVGFSCQVCQTGQTVQLCPFHSQTVSSRQLSQLNNGKPCRWTNKGALRMYFACRGLTQENQENILCVLVWPYQLDLVCHATEFQSLLCGSLVGATCWQCVCVCGWRVLKFVGASRPADSKKDLLACAGQPWTLAQKQWIMMDSV